MSTRRYSPSPTPPPRRISSSHICRLQRNPDLPGAVPMDPHFWKACAGGVASVPAVNSDVYYFPQGHAEQAATPPSFLPHHLRRPFVLSRVLSVDQLADRETDEVFARIRLRPLPPDSLPQRVVAEGGDGGGGVRAFGKRLTLSDANNGGGFSVPRGCAVSIFPKLNYMENQPVQNIYLLDAHGEEWEFRHIYRGTPRRHLLTTGWGKFVNAKKLIAGDSVVFGRRQADNRLLVGLRRTSRPSAGGGEGFWRSTRGRLPAETVVAAAEMAAAGEAFEVVYYPKAGRPPFVVGTEAVHAAAQVGWMVGLKVKMAVQTEDASSVNYFHGSIEAISGEESGTWLKSPWRMLQVKWDKPEVQHFRSVSPWQIELATNLAHAQVAKTLRPQMDVDAIHTNLGMQGARHLSLDIDMPTAPLLSNSDHREHPRSSTPPPVCDVSTELRVGCVRPREEDVSTEKLESNSSSSSPVKSGVRSFKLFGQLIPRAREQYGDHTGQHGDETLRSSATSNHSPFQACGHTKSVKSPCPPRTSSVKLSTR